MNVLDEDIPKGQRLLLESWRVRVQQIGVHIGRRGMADEAIAPMLLQHRRSTFFTRDEGFYDRSLCHPQYSLIYLDVNKYETAAFIRRVLRQKDLNTQAKRMGTVVRVSAAGLSVWRAHAGRVARLTWKSWPPRVGALRQPWALLRNPFGVSDGPALTPKALCIAARA